MSYQGSDLLGALQALHPTIDLSQTSLAQSANTAAAQGMDPGTFASQNASNPIVGETYSQYFQNLANPTINNLQEQGANAQNQFQVNQNTQNQNFNQNSAAIQNNADSLGLSRSGYNGNQLSANEAQRANTLSSLALQNEDTQAGINAQIASTQQQVGTQASNAELQDTQTYNQNQQAAFGELQNVNPSLAATDPSYLNLLNTIMQRAGLGTLDPNELATYYKTQVGNATGTATGTTTPSTTAQTTSTTPAASNPAAQYGISDEQWSDALPNLQKIFSGQAINPTTKKPYYVKGGKPAQDTTIEQLLEQQYGLNPSSAASLYYKARGQIIGS